VFPVCRSVIQEPLDKIRIGRIRPASITSRILLPDTTRPMVVPCRADDLSDDPDFRERATRLTARHAHAILDGVQGLLARTRYLLLDFDGPVCDIFAGLPATAVAERLRKLITGQPSSCLRR
jgi:hypothetical protein